MLHKIAIHFALTFGSSDAPHYFLPTKLILTGLSLVCPLSFEYFPHLYEHLCWLEANSLDSSEKIRVNYQGVVGRSDGSSIPVFETTSTDHNQTMVCRLKQVRTEDYSCLVRDFDNNNRVETNMPATANPNLYFEPEKLDDSQLAVTVSVPGDECVINTIKDLQSSVLYAQPPRCPKR